MLLQAAYNYRERGMRVLLFTCAAYAGGKPGIISSRLGISEDAELYDDDTDLYVRIHDYALESKVDCVFLDEVQCLTRDHVWQLARVADRFRYLYDERQIAEWLPTITAVSEQAEEVHLVFNNCYGNYGTTNALETASMLLREGLAEP